MKYSKQEFLKRLYKRVVLGKVRKKLTLFDLKKEDYTSLVKPVFVLSTGRCRTNWLTHLISEQKNVFVEHDPEITFLQEGKLIYENLSDHEQERYLLSQLVFTARDQSWLDCAKRDLRYIETNNRITFAAPFLKLQLHDSKFLHLTRHPIDFIKSGRNRKWYEGGSHDLGRITYKDKTKWDTLNLNQKIGWLWYETNRFIIEHTQDLSPKRYCLISSEDLDEKGVNKAFTFLELDVSKISSGWFKETTNEQENWLALSKEEIYEDLKKSFFYSELHKMAGNFGYKL